MGRGAWWGIGIVAAVIAIIAVSQNRKNESSSLDATLKQAEQSAASLPSTSGLTQEAQELANNRGTEQARAATQEAQAQAEIARQELEKTASQAQATITQDLQAGTSDAQTQVSQAAEAVQAAQTEPGN